MLLVGWIIFAIVEYMIRKSKVETKKSVVDMNPEKGKDNPSYVNDTKF